jgi:hypothetical protein
MRKNLDTLPGSRQLKTYSDQAIVRDRRAAHGKAHTRFAYIDDDCSGIAEVCVYERPERDARLQSAVTHRRQTVEVLLQIAHVATPTARRGAARFRGRSYLLIRRITSQAKLRDRMAGGF